MSSVFKPSDIKKTRYIRVNWSSELYTINGTRSNCKHSAVQSTPSSYVFNNQSETRDRLRGGVSRNTPSLSMFTSKGLTTLHCETDLNTQYRQIMTGHSFIHSIIHTTIHLYKFRRKKIFYLSPQNFKFHIKHKLDNKYWQMNK